MFGWISPLSPTRILKIVGVVLPGENARKVRGEVRVFRRVQGGREIVQARGVSRVRRVAEIPGLGDVGAETLVRDRQVAVGVGGRLGGPLVVGPVGRNARVEVRAADAHRRGPARR